MTTDQSLSGGGAASPVRCHAFQPSPFEVIARSFGMGNRLTVKTDGRSVTFVECEFEGRSRNENNLTHLAAAVTIDLTVARPLPCQGGTKLEVRNETNAPQ